MKKHSSQEITLGRLLPGHSEVGEGVNKPVRGIADTPRGEVTVIAKKIGHKGIATEILCAKLGILMDLPIPEPLVLLDENNDLFFGSVDVGHPSFARFINLNDPAISKKLSEWPDLIKAACFDELIANDDRSNGNLIYDGDSFFLIDHELAIPLSMEAANWDWDDDFYLNSLLSLVISLGEEDDIKQQRSINEARNWSQKCTQEKAEIAGKSIPASIYQSSDLINFIAVRALGLREALHTKIRPNRKQPELSLNV